MQNSIVAFTFSVLDWKYSFGQICQFKLKFGSKTNLNMQNSMVVFAFAVLEQKYLFWANLIQKIKIVSLA